MFAARCSLLLLFASTTLALAAAKPNVILIITDDQGYGDLSCHGNPVLRTPHLDALHAGSIRLTDYHVSPTCAPTRAALMTGRYANRTGCWHTINGRSILRSDEVTMGQVFQKAGYATAMIGKWHLGDNHPSRPEDKGFTEVYRHGGGGVGQTPDFWDNAYFDGSYFHNGKPEPAQGYCTDVFFTQAKRFIQAQADAKRPFFVYLCTNAPHGPNHSPDSFAAPYARFAPPLAHFYGMIANLDQNVGSLRAFLAERQLAQDTLFIFTTDNGTASGARIFNAGMRGQKGSEYDGGHRVPFFLHWPARGWNTGRDIDRLTAHVDILPTLIDLLHLPSAGGLPLDGTSLAPLLEGQSPVWPDRVLVTDSQRIHTPVKWRKSAVMTDRWRLVNGAELFDMEAGAAQDKDCASQFPEVVARLRQDYERWWASMEASFADDCEISLGSDAANPVTLTAHDWLLPGETLCPWNHSSIRAQEGQREGFWAVQVVQAGRYRIRLLRWPPEAHHPIAAGLPPGSPVPGVPASRTKPGTGFPASRAILEIAGQRLEAPVPAHASEVPFEVDLPAGITRLQGTFLDADGSRLGSYYAVAERR